MSKKNKKKNNSKTIITDAVQQIEQNINNITNTSQEPTVTMNDIVPIDTTQESANNHTGIIPSNNVNHMITDKTELIKAAYKLLSPRQYQQLIVYINNNGTELNVSHITQALQYLLEGYTLDEIAKKLSVPSEAVYMSYVKYNWEFLKHNHLMELQQAIFTKIAKTQIEMTELYCNIIAAAQKQYNQKLKKYLETGDEEELQSALKVSNINDLIRLAESLQRILGKEHKQITVRKEENVNIKIQKPDTNIIDTQYITNNQDSITTIPVITESNNDNGSLNTDDVVGLLKKLYTIKNK